MGGSKGSSLTTALLNWSLGAPRVQPLQTRIHLCLLAVLLMHSSSRLAVCTILQAKAMESKTRQWKEREGNGRQGKIMEGKGRKGNRRERNERQGEATEGKGKE